VRIRDFPVSGDSSRRGIDVLEGLLLPRVFLLNREFFLSRMRFSQAVLGVVFSNIAERRDPFSARPNMFVGF